MKTVQELNQLKAEAAKWRTCYTNHLAVASAAFDDYYARLEFERATVADGVDYDQTAMSEWLTIFEDRMLAAFKLLESLEDRMNASAYESRMAEWEWREKAERAENERLVYAMA